MVFAKKKWGQNFLVDNNLLEKIIKTINIKDTEHVLEIGPGQGALSEKLVDVAKSLSMVEIDPDLIERLKVHEKLSGGSSSVGKLSLLYESRQPVSYLRWFELVYVR